MLHKQVRKILSGLVTVALVLALLPAISFATTASDVTVYFSGFDSPPSANPAVVSVTTTGTPTAADVYAAAAGGPMPVPPLPAAILYTYNGAYGTKSVYDQTVGDGDLVEFFYVQDYADKNYAYVTVDPATAVIIDGRLKTKTATSSAIFLESTSLNYASPVIDRTATFNANWVEGADYAGYIVGGAYSYKMPSFVPVDVVTGFDDDPAWAGPISAQIHTDIVMAEAAANSGEITGTALATLQTAIANAQSAVGADAQGDALIALGNLLYTQNHSPEARARNITFNHFLGTEVPFDPSLSYVGSYGGQPVDEYIYRVVPNDGGDVFYGSDVTLSVDTGIPFDPYAMHVIITNDATDVVNGDMITFANGGEKIITVTITSSGGAPATRAYKFSLAVKIPAGGGVNPMAVDGYLPVGQYANTTVYGSISLDGENKLIYTPADYKKNVKGIKPYDGSGVSLGAGAGYVQYEFDPNTPVTNDASHPYGVDFVIYGNAVNSNSEAGAVKVSTDGKTWYELAGALYYDDATQRSIDVYYRLATGTGVQYQFGPAGFVPAPTGWKTFVTNTDWWPHYDPLPLPNESGNYGESSGILGPYSPSTVPVTDVTYDQSADDQIAYRNVTLVTGTRDTKAFPFGYADTHPNGVDYGTAVNPYAFPGAGGDGFDLSWAVEANGEPHAFAATESVRFVRVYTAAAIDPKDPTSFTPPDIFGEISTEVLGVYTPTNGGSGQTTAAATISFGGTTYTTTPISNTQGITTISQSTPNRTYTIGNTATNTYLNGKQLSSMSLQVSLGTNETKIFQIITQGGDSNAYVNLVKISRP